MGLREFRLASGLVLAVFLGLHLINHALGLFGLAALEAGREIFNAIWAKPWGIVVLALAFPMHVFLSLYALYLRRSYRQVSPREWLQLGLGVLIPPLLCIHILGTLGINLLFDSRPDYGFLLLVMFHFSTIDGIQQLLVMVVAWSHAALGLHFWWRLKPFYQRWGAAIRLGFWLLPTLALAGIAAGAREVLFKAEQEGWVEQWLTAARAPASDQVALVYRLEGIILTIYGAVLLSVFLARWLRRLIEHRQGLIQINYPDGRQVAVKRGFSLLDASLLAGVPHAHVCGGRGRCSTCRVRVLKGAQHLPEASSEERKVLQRIAAGPDLRLACQTRPLGDVSIVPLLPPNASPRDGFPRPGYLQGQEREIVVLFADLRGFTSLSEHRLPYDVVFILNRYFRATGQAIEENGGHLDKFIGDGVMALFGLESTPEVAARQALSAARQMGQALSELNTSLVQELGQPLRIGVGLHLGAAIVGEMGHGKAVHLTAIGDTVNAASRLESATKELKVELVVSEKLARSAGWELPGAGRHDIDLKGREGKLAVLAVEKLADLDQPQEGLAAR